jgi:hypothetical protein
MKKASNYAFISKPKQQQHPAPMAGGLFGPPPPAEVDLNVFVLTFDGLK